MIKIKSRTLLITLILLVFFSISLYLLKSKPDSINAHIGKPYIDIVKDSTFPVERKTAFYPSDPPQVDSTWINSPVVITFDDPVYGFTLPTTVYGAVGYGNGKVNTITTSPMVETLPFSQTADLLNELQSMLKAVGWKPQHTEGNNWINVSTEEDRHQLQTKLFNQADGVILLIPHQYSLLLHIKCYARCDERNTETAKYLIDVGLGKDYFSNREHSH